ncbi:DUF2243 domain-containing protein [Jatrophihabitans lederbergiae]|uniref:DUF2243 domain-containing protein n=1 Tax=Jatrophihabitans lederbergiae TaxID=3075547 RepID=A0ABU2J9Z2_9ACTN|nr:DUF2243 domain-containing protein [Jatrophihabitans sp. DSM 44399]MDT0261807.1 DUF2243 domain-containing protein [Jatrophihabitans sp. DSM 44399]
MDTPAIATRRSIWSGVLIGVGVAAFVDETVFHQLLHWHHFYDKSTADVGLVSDGFFHAGGWLAIVVGLFLFADLQRRRAASGNRLWGGGFLGWGAFQLYDGLIQHKVFGLHQIRYHVDVLPYDVVWNVAGGAGVLIGLLLLRRAAQRSSTQPVA